MSHQKRKRMRWEKIMFDLWKTLTSQVLTNMTLFGLYWKRYHRFECQGSNMGCLEFTLNISACYHYCVNVAFHQWKSNFMGKSVRCDERSWKKLESTFTKMAKPSYPSVYNSTSKLLCFNRELISKTVLYLEWESYRLFSVFWKLLKNWSMQVV